MAKQELGPHGGTGGAPFFVDNITKINKISVAYTIDGVNSFINAITITYMDNKGKKTVTWGKPGRDSQEKKNEVENKTCYPILPGPFEQFILQPGEYITNIKGYCGESSKDSWIGVRELTFVTNMTTHGPYGIKVGNPFELPANNGTIVGFHGRAGGLLDALGVYIYEDGDTGGSTGPTCG